MGQAASDRAAAVATGDTGASSGSHPALMQGGGGGVAAGGAGGSPATDTEGGVGAGTPGGVAPPPMSFDVPTPVAPGTRPATPPPAPAPGQLVVSPETLQRLQQSEWGLVRWATDLDRCPPRAAFTIAACSPLLPLFVGASVFDVRYLCAGFAQTRATPCVVWLLVCVVALLWLSVRGVSRGVLGDGGVVVAHVRAQGGC